MSMSDVYGLDPADFDFEEDCTSKRRVNSNTRQRIFKRDNYQCLKCGSTKITIDHIKPLALGGLNGYKNLQTLCKKCNEEKGCTEVDYRISKDV